MLQQFISLAVVATMAIPPASSQGIPRNSCADCSHIAMAAPATYVLVATPFTNTPGDSVNAVALGNGIRDKLAGNINGGEWQVVGRLIMNQGLLKWGYGPDQVLPTDAAHQMAVSLAARMMVMTTIAKGPEGRYLATVRVAGVADDAGHVFKAAQLPGQQLADFGKKIADQIRVVFQVYSDAKACEDQQISNKTKAIESATKAVKLVPNYGFAEYCLGEIEQQKDTVAPAALQHFKNAAMGDPMSLKAMQRLAVIHIKQHDSTAVVGDFQQMITIAPTNRPLAEAAVNVFKQYGHPDAAEQVVEAQIKLDPSNPDWPNLKGNSCAAQAVGETDPAKAKPKFQCAYESFGQVFTIDPTRADSDFFEKIIFVAPALSDSLAWAKRYVEKYPSSVTPRRLETNIYLASGQVDSAVAAVNLITKIDPTETKPVMAVTLALLNAHREDAALQFAPFMKKYADDDAKNQYAGILATFADSASRKTPQDDSVMVHLGQAIVDLNPADKSRLEFGHYFVVRGLQAGLTSMSASVRADKSCDGVKKYQELLNRLEPSLTTLAASANTGIATYGAQLLPLVQGEQKVIPTLQGAFCKP